jgi:hypothetical protein
MGDEGAGALAESFCELSCTGLRLSLSRNAVGVDGACALLAAMASACSCPAEAQGGRGGGGGREGAVESVEMQGIMLDDDDLARIVEAIGPQGPRESKGGGLDPREGAALGPQEAGARVGGCVEAEVDLRKNGLGQAVKEALSAAAASRSCFIRLIV